MDIKALFKKHMLTIFAVISLIALALPLCTIVTETESFIGSTSAKATVSGFSAMGKSFFAYFMLIGPALIIAMNYIKPLEKYKGILAIAIPLVCIVSAILVFIQVKGSSASASNEYASAEISANIGIGLILAFLSYIATAVAGAVTYHNFTLDKAGIEKLKQSSKEMINSVSSKASEVVSNVRSEKSEISENGKEAPARTSNTVKKTDLSHADDVLAVIEKLHSMKEKGMLSEEEFAEKKKALLEEIK